MGHSAESLPPDKRVEHYRGLANEAIRQSQMTFDEVRRAEYLAMAASWHNLAVEAERAIRNEVAAEFAPPVDSQSEPSDLPEVGGLRTQPV